MRSAIESLILVLLLSACGHRKVVDIPAEFQSAYKGFERVAAEHGVEVSITDLKIEFVDALPDSKIGRCETNPWQTPTIKILLNYWLTADATRKELLLFHEIGHCIFNYEHTENEHSIMSVRTMSLSEYDANRDAILDSFFKDGT